MPVDTLQLQRTNPPNSKLHYDATNNNGRQHLMLATTQNKRPFTSREYPI